MRVVMIHQHDPSVSHVGGIQTFLDTFVKYSPEDFEIFLAGVTTDEKRNPVGKRKRLEVGGREFDFFPIVAAHPNRRGLIPLSVRLTAGVQRFRREIPWDGSVVELHRVEPALALGGVKQPKALFLHVHPQDLRNPKTEVVWGKFPDAYDWLEARLIRQMSRVYIVREDAVPVYKRKYPALADRVEFLPTWVDEEVFVSLPEERRAEEKRRLAPSAGLDPSRKWLLFVGRFEGQKDPMYLLESFRALNGSTPPSQLVLIGEGSMEGQIRAAVARFGLQERVRIVPPVGQADLARWMNSADCLVLSSAFEGMPRVVVESLHCGLPVVSTDVGETRRLIGDSAGGRLVHGRTPEEFRGALAGLLSGPPTREACRRQAAPFTARAILEPVYSAYRRLSLLGAGKC